MTSDPVCFEKKGGTHIGIFTVDINYAGSQFLVNLLIGEPEYRNKHITSNLTVPFREYFSETLGLNVAMASALARTIDQNREYANRKVATFFKNPEQQFGRLIELVDVVCDVALRPDFCTRSENQAAGRSEATSAFRGRMTYLPDSILISLAPAASRISKSRIRLGASLIGVPRFDNHKARGTSRRFSFDEK